jgi:outer membrane protein TolC
VDDLGTFTGAFTGDDAIRAFALDPAIVGADIEGALAKFDTRFITQMAWNKVDTATSNLLNNFTNGDTAQFSSGFYKPLPTGGFASASFATNYTKLAAPPTGFSVINPAYQPSLNFNFEQPLWKDYGIEINQLLASHPNSNTIAPGGVGLQPSGGRPNGILIQRVKTEQQRADFERSVNTMLFNVENAYWALYANYFGLYAQEQGLRQAYITWQLTKSEVDAGKKTAYELAQVRATFAQFRQQRIDSLQAVIESERQLRGLLALPIEDGKRIVPADAPTLAPVTPDWPSAVTEALANRPELLIARQDVKVNQMNVMLQHNGTRPDFRFFANYNINAIGTQLDGSNPGNAYNNLAENKFNNWGLGLRMDMPLGFRDANAALRAAQLNLARSFIVLKNQELKAERFLAAVFQNMVRYYRDIEAYQEQRKALADQLRGLYARIQAGKDPLIVVLTAQTQFAQALANEYNAIANYNIALAGLEYAKGTIMQYNNITIADGPLPNCVLARAREHYEQQAKGIIGRERATLPTSGAPPTLPSLLEHQPPTPETPAELQGAAGRSMMPMPISGAPVSPANGDPASRSMMPMPISGAPYAPSGSDRQPWTGAPTLGTPPVQPRSIPVNGP